MTILELLKLIVYLAEQEYATPELESEADAHVAILLQTAVTLYLKDYQLGSISAADFNNVLTSLQTELGALGITPDIQFLE